MSGTPSSRSPTGSPATTPMTGPGPAGVASLGRPCSDEGGWLDGGAGMARPGIDGDVEEIDEEVDEHEPCRDDQHGSLHHEVVPGIDRVEGEQPEAGQLEDVLHDEHPAYQRS